MNYINKTTEDNQNKIAPGFNTDNQVTVPVIASFNGTGGMIPLYFAAEGIRLKINNIKWVSTNQPWGTQYRCEITVQDRLETIDLYYYNTLRLWTMRKL